MPLTRDGDALGTCGCSATEHLTIPFVADVVLRTGAHPRSAGSRRDRNSARAAPQSARPRCSWLSGLSAAKISETPNSGKTLTSTLIVGPGLSLQAAKNTSAIENLIRQPEWPK